MNDRLAGFVGSGLLIAGAFAVGGVLHEVFVKNTLSTTSPTAVGGLAIGCVLIYVGYRLESAFDPSSVVVGHDSEDGSDETEYNPETGPLSEADMEGYERDDSYK